MAELTLEQQRAMARARARARAAGSDPEAPTRDQATQVARSAAAREFRRGMAPFGLGYLATPLQNQLFDPSRQQVNGEAWNGLVRDVQQIPSLDLGQVGRDASERVNQAWQGFSRDPAGAIGRFASAIPGALGELTGVPAAQREEQAQQETELARLQGRAALPAARQASAATGQLAMTTLAPATISNSMLQTGIRAGALAAPFALSRNNDRPLQERLPDALLETGGAIALGSGLQGASRLFGRSAEGAEATRNQIRQRAENARRANVRLPLAAAEGRESAPYTMSLASNPVGGNVRTNLRNSANDVEARLAELADNTAAPTTPELAGERVQYDVNRFSNGPGRGRAQPQPAPGDPASIPVRDWNVSDKSRALYDHVEEPILAAEAAGRGTATAAGTLNVLREINSRVRLSGLAAIINNPRLKAIADALEQGQQISDLFGRGGITYQDLRALRSWVREAKGNPGLRGDITTGQLARLEGALTRDIYASADALGGAGAARNVQRVDRWYRIVHDRIENVLAPFADARHGTSAYQRIRQLATTRGSARTLERLRASLPEDAWRTVAASILRDMGRGADGSFSLGRFISEFSGRNGMTAEARQVLFGNMGTLLDDLNNLREVAGYLDEVRGFTNWSNTGASVQGWLTSGGLLTGGAFAAGGNPHLLAAMVGKLVVDRLAGEVLTNPRVVNLLAGLPKAGRTAAGSRAWLRRFAETAARDPALAPLLSTELFQDQPSAARGRPSTPQQTEALTQ